MSSDTTNINSFSTPPPAPHCLKAAWNTIKSTINPSKWQLTSEKTSKIAAATLFVCVASIAVSALMVQYPQISGAFFSLFGLVGIGSLLLFIISSMQGCKNADQSVSMSAFGDAEN